MKRGRGQPSKYRREFHNKEFIRLSRQGKTFAQIAAEWEVDRHTIQNWAKKHSEFLAAIKAGREFCEAWYMNLGQAAMVNQARIDGKIIKVELGWFVWMTKNMFKWSDRAEVNEVGPSQHRPLKDLTDEELDALSMDV